MGVPVPKLDDQFRNWNWNGAEMGSNIVTLCFVYVRPHFGTILVPELVVQFRNWNTHLPKLALAIFLCLYPFGDHTDLKYENRCSIFLNSYSEVG